MTPTNTGDSARLIRNVRGSMPKSFARHYQEIKLAADVEAWTLIHALAQSGTFAETHSAITALATVAEFTDAQLNAIARICLANGQVRRILRDSDVEAFVRKLIDG